MGARSQNIDALYDAAGASLEERSSAEWLDLLRQGEIPCGPVHGLGDLPGDPHLQAIGFFRDYDHPNQGRMKVPETPYKFDRQSLPMRHHHPRLNEQGGDILREAGCGEDDIRDMLGTEE